MNGIQNTGRPGVPDLQRQHLETGPLGRIGNVRFKAEPGATPRTSGPNALQRFCRFLSKVAFYVGASPAQRAQQFVLDQARDNSRRVGNLLGNLTAPPTDLKARSRLAEGLARLGDLSGGDLSRLPGGQESLKTYLSELGVMDLNALRSGVLGDPEARQAVLDRVDPPRLRAQAARLLDQITAALDAERAGQWVQEPLAQIKTLLGRQPIDGPALDAQLAVLSERLAMAGGETLGSHLQTLSDDELKALRWALRPANQDSARQALSQTRDPDVRPLSLEEAPDRIHETLDPQMLQSGRIRQGETLLDRIGLALDQEARARIDQALPEPFVALQDAITRGDSGGIVRALFELNQNVHHLQTSYGLLPDGMAQPLREQVARAMDALRHPQANPEGPLNRDTLARLDDHVLGLLRRSEALSAYGLQIDRDAARLEGLSRVQTLSDQVVQGVTGLLHVLSGETVDMPMLMRQLRDLTELELQRNRLLGDLGHYGQLAGVDDRKDMSSQAFLAALDTLRETGQTEVAQRAMDRLNLLLSLEQGFGGAVLGLGSIVSLGDYAQIGPETAKRVGTTQHMLDGITSAMYRVLTEQGGGQAPEISPPELPETFYSSLVEQYGVRYDPESVQSSVTLTDGMWAKLVPHLEEPIEPKIHTPHTVTLPVRGTDTEFSVGSSFFKDGIERPSVTLSVRGSGPDGSLIRSTWPQDVSTERRNEAMGEALDALVKVAGPAAEPLTHLMNQQLGAGILKGLLDMGPDSPFKLEDGTVVLPVGAGRFHFDIEKTEGGGFRVGATMTMPIEQASGLDRNGEPIPVFMDPSVSWAQVRVTLEISSDGLQFRLSEPPQFQHHFVLRP